MNKLQTHITNEICLGSLTNFHHMNSYEHCTEIEWRESKMDIALKKKPVKRFWYGMIMEEIQWYILEIMARDLHKFHDEHQVMN